MLTRNQTLDMTAIGLIFHISKTAEETNGESLEMEWEVLPKADGTPVHIHPSADETYKVLEGKLEVSINGQWEILEAPGELTVKKGVPHTFRNPTDKLTRVYNTHAPAMRFDDYFEALSNIVTKLSHGNSKKLKMDLNTITHLSMLMKKYKAEVLSVDPPNFLITVMNILGRISGIKV